MATLITLQEPQFLTPLTCSMHKQCPSADLIRTDHWWCLFMCNGSHELMLRRATDWPTKSPVPRSTGNASGLNVWGDLLLVGAHTQRDAAVRSGAKVVVALLVRQQLSKICECKHGAECKHCEVVPKLRLPCSSGSSQARLVNASLKQDAAETGGGQVLDAGVRVVHKCCISSAGLYVSSGARLISASMKQYAAA
eukprot:1160098-Pelagomonas_calceolata.AAC.3